jgi:elongation factor P--beta-lysine ligase
MSRASCGRRFLAALAAELPNCAGVALGFDRLVMVASGARQTCEVLTLPVDAATTQAGEDRPGEDGPGAT